MGGGSGTPGYRRRRGLQGSRRRPAAVERDSAPRPPPPHLPPPLSTREELQVRDRVGEAGGKGEPQNRGQRPGAGVRQSWGCRAVCPQDEILRGDLGPPTRSLPCTFTDVATEAGGGGEGQPGARLSAPPSPRTAGRGAHPRVALAGPPAPSPAGSWHGCPRWTSGCRKGAGGWCR